VIYDPYWDALAAYADKAEADGLCQPGRRFAGCHVLWAEEARPGDITSLPNDAFGDFLRSFDSHPDSDNR
jgi:hypothetical protein